MHHLSRWSARRYLFEWWCADWLVVLNKVRGWFNWVVHAYCQVTNHYHPLTSDVDQLLADLNEELENYW